MLELLAHKEQPPWQPSRQLHGKSKPEHKFDALVCAETESEDEEQDPRSAVSKSTTTAQGNDDEAHAEAHAVEHASIDEDGEAVVGVDDEGKTSTRAKTTGTATANATSTGAAVDGARQLSPSHEHCLPTCLTMHNH
jgi:hypothetical protein